MSGLSGQACASGDLLASKDRQLVYHSPLKLMDSKLKPPKEVVVFLFTDLLLLTQQNSTQVEKKNPKKEVWGGGGSTSTGLNNGCFFLLGSR